MNQNNRGMTLIELVIALAIIVITSMTFSIGIITTTKIFINTMTHNQYLASQKIEIQQQFEKVNDYNDIIIVYVNEKSINVEGQYIIQKANLSNDHINLILFKPNPTQVDGNE